MSLITHKHSFRAMNCQMSAHLISDAPQARQALHAVEKLMHQIEQEISRFLPHSDLSRLNAAAGHPYQAGKMLWDLVVEALAWAANTDGLFDPTVGRAMLAAGYDRSFELLTQAPAKEKSLSASSGAAKTSWHDIHLDPDSHTITLPPDVQLDLGGIAKGWAADRALEILQPLGPALVDAGGDLAIGAPPPTDTGWPIAVADPLRPEHDVALLKLAHVGLATSGTDHRRWRHLGQEQHHLIDPSRQKPAHTDILTSTVIAPSAVAADALALSLAIRGMHDTDIWLQKYHHIPTLLILTDGSIYQNQAFAHHVRNYFPTYQ